MRRSIATVCLSGTLDEKLAATARAGFDGVELFEADQSERQRRRARIEMDKARVLAIKAAADTLAADRAASEEAARQARLRAQQAADEAAREVQAREAEAARRQAPEANAPQPEAAPRP